MCTYHFLVSNSHHLVQMLLLIMILLKRSDTWVSEAPMVFTENIAPETQNPKQW